MSVSPWGSREIIVLHGGLINTGTQESGFTGMGREKTPSGESLAQQSPQCSQDSGAPPNPDCEFANDDSAVQLTGELDKRALLDTFSRHWLLLLMFGMTLFVCNTTNALLHRSAVFGPSPHPSSTHKNEAQSKKKSATVYPGLTKKQHFRQSSQKQH